MNQELGKLINDLTLLGGVDFHTHSTASDGSLLPDEVFQLAKINGLSCFALTDHDNNEGVLELLKRHSTIDSYMQDQNLSFRELFERIKTGHLKTSPLIIPGIELNVQFSTENIHILAYFSGNEIAKIEPFLKQQRQNRFKRNSKIIQKLNELKIPIPIDLLKPTADEPTPGRVKVAKWLVHKGYVSTISEAFEIYLGNNKLAYVARNNVSIGSALKFIKKMNGFPFVAHPHQYGWCENKNILRKKVNDLLKIDTVGIEVFHSDASIEEQKLIEEIASEKQIYISAGSDFHGANKEKHHLYKSTFSPDNHYGKESIS